MANRRSTLVLLGQMEEVRSYLAAAGDLAARAYALAPGGSVLPIPPSGTPRSKREARFVTAAHAVVDRSPHLSRHLATALTYLPERPALAVLLVFRDTHTRVAVAAALGVTEKTIATWLGRSLETLARLLWDDRGMPQAVPPRRKAPDGALPPGTPARGTTVGGPSASS